ncbi:MAG: hypothetical protein ACRDZ4_19910, partial [Egibacteraceae bacterium]
MRYTSAAALREALEARLATNSREAGIDLQQRCRQAMFERTLVRLVRAATGRVAWPWRPATDRARVTKDLDLALQGSTATGDEVRALLVESLSVDTDGDRFEFRAGPAWIQARRDWAAGLAFRRGGTSRRPAVHPCAGERRGPHRRAELDGTRRSYPPASTTPHSPTAVAQAHRGAARRRA